MTPFGTSFLRLVFEKTSTAEIVRLAKVSKEELHLRALLATVFEDLPSSMQGTWTAQGLQPYRWNRFCSTRRKTSKSLFRRIALSNFASWAPRPITARILRNGSSKLVPVAPESKCWIISFRTEFHNFVQLLVPPSGFQAAS